MKSKYDIYRLEYSLYLSSLNLYKNDKFAGSFGGCKKNDVGRVKYALNGKDLVFCDFALRRGMFLWVERKGAFI